MKPINENKDFVLVRKIEDDGIEITSVQTDTNQSCQLILNKEQALELADSIYDKIYTIELEVNNDSKEISLNDKVGFIDSGFLFGTVSSIEGSSWSDEDRLFCIETYNGTYPYVTKRNLVKITDSAFEYANKVIESCDFKMINGKIIYKES